MNKNGFRLIAALALSLLLVSCGNPGGPGDDRPAPEQATRREAIDGLNALMADAVSIASGIASNSTIGEAGGFPDCIDCGFDTEILVQGFPGIFAMFFESSETFEPLNVRLASGTYTYNGTTNRFDYEDQPSSALIVRWPHARTAEPMEVRIDWKDISKATTYDHPIDGPYVPFVPFHMLTGYPYLVSEELDVPGQITISARQDGTEIVHLDIEQTWADTTCGQLVEYRTVSASGFFRSGAQAVELDSFLLDHSKDEVLALSMSGSVKSGSLRLPFSLAAEATAGSVTRSPDNCQLNGIEGPYAGSFDLQVGSPDSGLGLEFDLSVAIEDDGLAGTYPIDLESARLTVGGKYVDITGDLDTDALSGYGDFTILMTFADRINYPIDDFVLDLTPPELP